MVFGLRRKWLFVLDTWRQKSFVRDVGLCFWCLWREDRISNSFWLYFWLSRLFAFYLWQTDCKSFVIILLFLKIEFDISNSYILIVKIKFDVFVRFGKNLADIDNCGTLQIHLIHSKRVNLEDNLFWWRYWVYHYSITPWSFFKIIFFHLSLVNLVVMFNNAFLHSVLEVCVKKALNITNSDFRHYSLTRWRYWLDNTLLYFWSSSYVFYPTIIDSWRVHLIIANYLLSSCDFSAGLPSQIILARLTSSFIIYRQIDCLYYLIIFFIVDGRLSLTYVTVICGNIIVLDRFILKINIFLHLIIHVFKPSLWSCRYLFIGLVIYLNSLYIFVVRFSKGSLLQLIMKMIGHISWQSKDRRLYDPLIMPWRFSLLMN